MVMEMLKSRQGDKAVEDFAHDMGVRSSSLWAYYREDKSIGLSNGRKMISYFQDQGDTEMVYALASFLLGVELFPSN